MLRLINRFRRDERGATAVEYTMLVVFIALAVVVGATALSTGINDIFGKVGTYLSTVPVPPTP